MHLKVKDLSMMAIMEALLIVCSKLSFNIGPIPLTFQTFAVFIIPLILGFKKSIIVFGLYIIMGIAGIPVFSKGGGWNYIFEPSFGFIIGFFFSAMVVSLGSKSNKFYTKYITSTIGLLILNIIGILYMYFIMNYYLELDKSISYVISVGFVPFIAKDIITVILACIVYSRLKVVIYKEETHHEDIQLYEKTNIN